MPITIWGRSSRWSLVLAEGAEPGWLALGRLLLVICHVAVLVSGYGFVGLVHLEVRAGGVEEQQAGLEVEQVRGLAVGLLLHRSADLVQPVHRPVAGVVGGLGQPVDPGLAAGPVRRRELGRGVRRPVATGANSTRSAEASRRVVVSRAARIAPMPSRCHNWSSSHGPP
jgi:hypothetical protein